MKNDLKIPTWLASLCVAAMIGLQGWSLHKISELGERVATLSERLNMHMAEKPLKLTQNER